MLRRVAHLFIAVALLVTGTLPMAWAARLQQARKRRFKACILVVPTPGEPVQPGNPWTGALPDPDAIVPFRSPNPNPFLFFVMNQRKDVLPDGWDFYNPAAPAFVTNQQALRWNAIAGANSVTVGTELKEDLAPYWEVLLSEGNFHWLSQMDVVYLPISRSTGPAAPVPTNFTEEQRRLLTRLADAGVCIWVDWAVQGPTAADMLGGAENPANPYTRIKNPFFTNLDTAAVGGEMGSRVVDPNTGRTIRHPLLTSPFLLSDDDIEQTGGTRGLGSAWQMGQKASVGRAWQLRAQDLQPTANFVTVVRTTNQSPLDTAYVAAARYGGGYVVATAGNTGRAISSMIPANTARYNNQDLSQVELEDLKFAYNVFDWTSETTAPGKNGRHTGQSNVQINGLVEQGTFPNLIGTGVGGPWLPYPQAMPPGPVQGLPRNLASPLIMNDLIIGATNFRLQPGGPVQTELNVFEKNPNEDFDENRFIDDPNTAASPLQDPSDPLPSPNGLVDVAIGQNYDRVLRLPSGVLNGPVVGLTAGDVPEFGVMGSLTGSKAFVFGFATTGLFSLPAPRRGMPTSDYWSAATFNTGLISGNNAPLPPNYQLLPSGAPGFANIPSGTPGYVNSQVYIAGQVFPSLTGANNGKVIAYDVTPNGQMTPSWYYPANQGAEATRLGPVFGPVTTAQVPDFGTGAIDTMVLVTSLSTGSAGGGQGQGTGGDVTGKVEGFITATKGDPLAFPQQANNANAQNPTAGRRFVSMRWLFPQPGSPPPPQPREIQWDPGRHMEVRVIDKNSGYVVARFVGPTMLRPLPDGIGGQVELPAPPRDAPDGTSPIDFAEPGSPQKWDLNRFSLLADYSYLPVPVDQNKPSIRPRFSPSTPFVRSSSQQNLIPSTGVAGGVTVGKDGLTYYGTGMGFMCAVEWRKNRPQFRWKMRALEFTDNAGTQLDINPNSPNYLQGDYVFTSAPAAGDRIVFAARGLGGGGAVYVLDPNATIRFKLPIPLNLLSRLDAAHAQDLLLKADSGIGYNPQTPGDFLASSSQPWGKSPEQFTVDPDSATVTFLNMENFSLDLRQALSPAQLSAMGIQTGGRPAVPIQYAFRNPRAGEPTTNNPATAYIPLPVIAIYESGTQPGNPAGNDTWLSSPVIAGDRAYVMGASGYLHELPLDPRRVNPNFPLPVNTMGQPAPFRYGFNLENAQLRKVRNIAAGTGTPSYASPAISTGMLAVTSPRGLTMFNSPNIVVADGNRVVEASGDSTALATTESVLKHRIDLSEFAIPTEPAFANTGGRPILTERKVLNRLAVVRKLNPNSSLTSLFLSSDPSDAPSGTAGGVNSTMERAEESYLVADTGNNRCVEFNPAGKVVWELDQFQDPFQLLPSGEPLKLSGPMDVQRWIEQEDAGLVDSSNNPIPVYVIHTLITDTGNNRVLEIVDKIGYQRGVFNAGSYVTLPNQRAADDQTPIRWYHVLVWSSQTNAQGLRLRYRSAQRVFWWNAATDTPFDMLTPAQRAIAGNGRPLPAEGQRPYLPPERYLSYTMATVQGQRVEYEPLQQGQQLQMQGYFRTYPGAITPNRQSLWERKPIVRAGGDSVVFLRGRHYMENGTTLLPAPLPREPYLMGQPPSDTRARFSQGVVDPFLPTMTDIWDELVDGQPASPDVQPVHTLRGIATIQRTVRSDVKFAPEEFGNTMPRRPYFLIADTAGVWEVRMLPGTGAFPATVRSPYRLAWAFTNEDYGYVTGAGNGNPTRIYSTAGSDHVPGGRRLYAVSARRLPSGMVLITSRVPGNELVVPTTPVQNGTYPPFYHQHVGADVFLLRPGHFRTAKERQVTGAPVPYNRRDLVAGAVPLHGWHPDQWVQQLFPANFATGGSAAGLAGAPSIRWRAAEQFNPLAPPDVRGPFVGGTNPGELTGSYIPIQPNYADLVY